MFKTAHLLITDDDRDFRETLRSLFQPPRFQTMLAANGEEAIRIARESQVHLALLDFQMPRLTGLEAVRQLKALKANLPCILISGAVTETVVAEAEEASVFSILRKPISIEEVRCSVRQALLEAYGWLPHN